MGMKPIWMGTLPDRTGMLPDIMVNLPDTMRTLPYRMGSFPTATGCVPVTQDSVPDGMGKLMETLTEMMNKTPYISDFIREPKSRIFEMSHGESRFLSTYLVLLQKALEEEGQSVVDKSAIKSRAGEAATAVAAQASNQ